MGNKITEEQHFASVYSEKKKFDHVWTVYVIDLITGIKRIIEKMFFKFEEIPFKFIDALSALSILNSRMCHNFYDSIDEYNIPI